MPVNPPLDRLLPPVAKALAAGRAADAVHQFMQALSHDTSLKHVDLGPLLAKSLGKARAAELVEAFAEHPCMVCRRGLMLCEECAGKGSFGEQRICDACIGLGAANCAFCAGSGWITYNYVPAGMRAAVVLARTKLALAEAREIIAAPAPNPRRGSSSLSRKELAQRILRVNRLLGAFNNALGVALHPPVPPVAVDSGLKKVKEVCARASAGLERRLRELLLLIATNAAVEAQRAPQPARKKAAEARARFYAGLARSADFTGTNLYHPYLQELRPRPQASAPDQPSPETPD